MELRRATAGDAAFIAAMLEEAVNWDPDKSRHALAEAAATYPELLRYAEGWGRGGDEGFIAEEDGRAIGAGWFRLFPESEPGFGFIAEDVPELAIAVEKEYRGRGIGTALMEALLDLAREFGYAQISLNTAGPNPARRLYERFGFTLVEEDDEGYVTMKVAL